MAYGLASDFGENFLFFGLFPNAAFTWEWQFKFYLYSKITYQGIVMQQNKYTERRCLKSSEVKTSNEALCSIRIWEGKQAFNWFTQTVDNCAFHCSDNSGYKHPYLIFVTTITSGACGEKLCHEETNSCWENSTFWWKYCTCELIKKRWKKFNIRYKEAVQINWRSQK